MVQEHPILEIEQLQTLNMVKNHKLARSKLEQRWATFVRALEYKAERANGRVVKVNPTNTSPMGSSCSSVKAALLLSERLYSCFDCGIEIERNVNSAPNILRLAQTMSSARVSGFGFGTGVKEIDGSGNGKALSTQLWILSWLISHLNNPLIINIQIHYFYRAKEFQFYG